MGLLHSVLVAGLSLLALTLFAYNTLPFYAARLFRPRATRKSGIFRTEVFVAISNDAQGARYYVVYQNCSDSLNMALKLGNFYVYLFKRMHPKHRDRIFCVAVAKKALRQSLTPFWLPKLATRSSELPHLSMIERHQDGSRTEIKWQPGTPEKIWSLDKSLNL